jgi:hypothetical protein
VNKGEKQGRGVEHPSPFVWQPCAYRYLLQRVADVV